MTGAAIHLSPRALADLDDIWEYSATEWSVRQADDYVRAIHEALTRIGESPQLARKADDVRPGLHRYSIGSHVLFLRFQSDSVVVVRILHGHMDFARHLTS